MSLWIVPVSLEDAYWSAQLAIDADDAADAALVAGATAAGLSNYTGRQVTVGEPEPASHRKENP